MYPHYRCPSVLERLINPSIYSLACPLKALCQCPTTVNGALRLAVPAMESQECPWKTHNPAGTGKHSNLISKDSFKPSPSRHQMDKVKNADGRSWMKEKEMRERERDGDIINLWDICIILKNRELLGLRSWSSLHLPKGSHKVWHHAQG